MQCRVYAPVRAQPTADRCRVFQLYIEKSTRVAGCKIFVRGYRNSPARRLLHSWMASPAFSISLPAPLAVSQAVSANRAQAHQNYADHSSSPFVCVTSCVTVLLSGSQSLGGSLTSENYGDKNILSTRVHRSSGTAKSAQVGCHMSLVVEVEQAEPEGTICLNRQRRKARKRLPACGAGRSSARR